MIENLRKQWFPTACLVILCGWCLTSTPQAADPPPKTEKELRIEALVAQARQRMEKSEWDAALKECNSALEIDPESGLALNTRGIALNGKGEYDSAIKDFDKVSSKPAISTAVRELRSEAFSNRSVSLYRQGKYLPAIDSGYFATLEKSDNHEAHNNRAMAYVGRGDFDKAIGAADKAIRFKESFGEAYSTRGMAYLGKKNVDQAIKDQTKAVELSPNFAPAFHRRAIALIASAEAKKSADDLKKAMDDLGRAITLRPDFGDAICDRALLYGGNIGRDMPKAMAELDGLIKTSPNFPRGYYQRALANMDKKEYELALTDLNQAIKLNANYADAYSLRGYSNNGKKEFDAALEDFNKAIELNPKLSAAYAGRSTTLTRLKKPKEARADQDKVAELNPPPPPKAAPAKKTEEPSPRFVVKTKEVNPKRLKEALKSAGEVDRLVQVNYEQHKITPLPKTTDEQFLRRVYLDIAGTIPTYVQVRKFLSSKSPTRRSELIDELLGSPAYAGNAFNYWADVLRYTDNLNGNVRGEPYRQWIKQSLAEDKPWDKIVYEMLTASGRIWENPATGYLQRDPGMPLDTMNNTVRTFLGTRIGCAQCHNHPFDRWTQKEFYEMAAFTFGTLQNTHGGDTRYWSKNPNERLQEEYAKIEQEEEDRRNNSYRFDRFIGINMQIVNDQDRKIQLPKNYAYNNAKPEEVIAPKALFGPAADIKPGEAPRMAFARWLTSKENPRFAKVIANRLWKQVFGIGQIEPVDDMMDETMAENPPLMTFLEGEMKRLNFDMKEYLRILFNTETYQRQACVEDISLGSPYHFPGPMLRRMTAEQVWDSFLTLAVVDPDEYRELPAKMRTDVIGVDLLQVSAKKMLDADSKGNEIDYTVKSKREQKYTYKGVLLARASELPSPVPANHFLRSFGQSDREQIAASSTGGSVPQVLFMFNGPITHMLLEPKSTIYNNVMKKKDSVTEAVAVIFETILTRAPDQDEMNFAKEEIKKNGPAGYGNVIWSLVNTREFLFVQ